jgi:hypothetical protein
MRRSLILLTVLAAVCASVTTPALAGKPKKGSFDAQALPYPGQDNGCNDATAPPGFGRVTQPFKAPANGLLTLTLSGYEGDWDLYITDEDGNELSSDTAPPGVPGSTSSTSISLAKGAKVLLAPCNWIGTPLAHAEWEFESGR